MRIALACPGVGLSQRGFERMFLDLYRLIEHDVDVTLFKGGGPESAREIVPAFLPRNGRFVNAVPVHRLLGRSPIHVECLTYALALLPHLRRGDFDLVHCIDPPLVRMLYKLRRWFGLRFRLLYTHGCTMQPADYPPADHLQHVADGPYHECLDAGFAPSSMTLLPCGFHPQRFEVEASQAELRQRFGIADDCFVILSVAALNRGHKRVHHLIDEAAQLPGNILLWLDSSMDQGEPDLIAHAHTRLGERCRITHVPSAQVGELYKAADVLVHAAVFEAFGLAIVEAASTGLPVLVHDAPHFRWLLPERACWVDMAQPSALAARLAQLREDPAQRAALRCPQAVRQRFSWHDLRADYLALYERSAALPIAARAGVRINYFSQLHG